MFGMFGVNPWFMLGIIAVAVISAALLVACFAGAEDHDNHEGDAEC